MKHLYSLKTYSIGLFLIFIISFSGLSQVGIGNTNPNADALLEVGDGTDTGGVILPRVILSATDNFSPLTAHVQGMMVYNTVSDGTGYTAVTPGQYYNDGSKWIRVGAEEKPIDSVTLSADFLVSGTTYTDIPGMSLTFIARKSSVLVSLSASGLGYTESISNVSLRVENTTAGTTIGGTSTKVQNVTIISYGRFSPTIDAQYSTTTWSATFAKPLTGLTIGNTYTLNVQGNTSNVYGTDGAAIYPVSYPDSSYLTLSVLQ